MSRNEIDANWLKDQLVIRIAGGEEDTGIRAIVNKIMHLESQENVTAIISDAAQTEK